MQDSKLDFVAEAMDEEVVAIDHQLIGDIFHSVYRDFKLLTWIIWISKNLKSYQETPSSIHILSLF